MPKNYVKRLNLKFGESASLMCRHFLIKISERHCDDHCRKTMHCLVWFTNCKHSALVCC